MKRILPLPLLILGLMVTAYAQQPNTQAFGQPLLVLTETDPSLNVPGSDVPSFALYDSGHIIYKVHTGDTPQYYQTRLAQEQLQELIGRFGISKELLELPDRSQLPVQASTQPGAELYINLDTMVVKHVRGDLRNDEGARKQAPAPFLRTYDKIVAYSDPHATFWLPDKIEVLFTDYLQPASKFTKWPAGWANLKSPDTVWRSEKLYSVYLDKAHYPQFLKLLKELGNQQVVEVNGKKFSVSYRLPFPNISQASSD